MKRIFLLITVLIHSVGFISAQNANDPGQRELYKKLFLEGCITEAKSQKLNVNARSFCTCSFEKLYSLIEESGADLSDARALDQITQSKEYEAAIFACLNGNDESADDVFEKEFVRICAKNMNKDKYMRKNTNANEICSCTYSKIKDGPYSMMDLNELPVEETSKYIEKISAECMKYYFESQGIILE
ncbi:MAG TPA: hypothetical protein VLZ75_02175 [Chitinophagales bacterium]|nr:hypothetical protein [Chitinophagales bacterium]